MACTVSHLRLSQRGEATFPEGLFVVVTRENERATRAEGNDGDGMTEEATSPSSSLSVTATDCDRCWSADDVRPKPDTTIENWTDQVACALAGGTGDGDGGGEGGTAGASTAAAPSTFDGALIEGSTSHSASASLLDDGRLQLSLSWKVPGGDENRARIKLKPDDGGGSATRRRVVAVALSSARAACAAAAELSSQVRSLSLAAARAQRNAAGWEDKWRAREGELFSKFCAVLNEKKREAGEWRRRALAAEGRLSGGGGGGVGGAETVSAADALLPAPAAPAPDLVPMPVDLGGAAEEAGVAEAAAVAAAAADDGDDFDGVRGGEEVEDREVGGEDLRNDSERSGGEDEDGMTEPGDWDPQSEGEDDDDAQS